MRALVTGAAGFVGANLVRRLLRDGHEVHAVCQPGHDAGRLAGLHALATHELDLTAPGAAVALVRDTAPDWIFHLAAHGAYSWQTDAARICATNLLATIALADAAERHRVRALVHAGSSSEYGFKDHAPAEDERPDPNSAYAVTKAAATMYCRHRARTARLPAVTLRLYSVYGPLEDERRLVPALIRHCLDGRLPPLAAPETARDFVYADDVCGALVLAAERAGELAGGVYNVGSGHQTTLRELVECARTLFGVDAEPSWGAYPQRTWDTSVWRANVARAASELGWTAGTSLADGLRRTATSIAARLTESSVPPPGRSAARPRPDPLR